MRVPVPTGPKTSLVSADVVPVGAAEVLTLGLDWVGWKLGGDFRGSLIGRYMGSFVRLRPPPGVGDKEARDVRDALRALGASVVVEMSAEANVVLPGEAPVERPHLRAREVVRAVVEEGASLRKAELRALTEEIMGQQGL